MAGKKIAVFFDGTWNTPKDSTRVRAAYDLVKKDSSQVAKYFRGLGTDQGQAFTGGVFAKGLGENVREGYQWLVDNYNDGDELFIFGFSRGAFTATSVTGMIMRFGLLRKGAPFTTQEIFDRYTKWDQHPTYYSLENRKQNGDANFSVDETNLLKFSRRPQIKMMGLWDSVATIGIPIFNISRFSRHALKFHNPRPSSIYDNIFHALAIDENRKPFRSVLFNDYIPSDEKRSKTIDNRIALEQRAEQRWFSGSHGDVGGGDNILVSNGPYKWILENAERLGLDLDVPRLNMNDFHEKALNDSFKGIYPFLRFGKRFYRKIGRKRKAVTGGTIEPIHETIDSSVFERWRADPTYRPSNLKRLFVDEKVIRNQVGVYKISPEGRV